MQLSLGTVQFGLAYGIAGRDTPVEPAEVRNILALAQSAGITTLDTAAAYGDIEERLKALCEGFDFHIVSKIPPVPGNLPPIERSTWVAAMVERSKSRLGERLCGLMFHQAQDLLGPDADALWSTALRLTQQKIALGVSCYSTAELDVIGARLPVAMAQLPGNAFDQQLVNYRVNATVWVRSAFLQGALLMSADDACSRLPEGSPWIRAWHVWCQAHGYTPLQAALGLIKGMACADYCVVGVDSAAHLEKILAAWQQVPPLVAPELACPLAQVTDPRLWKKHP